VALSKRKQCYSALTLRGHKDIYWIFYCRFLAYYCVYVLGCRLTLPTVVLNECDRCMYRSYVALSLHTAGHSRVGPILIGLQSITSYWSACADDGVTAQIELVSTTKPRVVIRDWGGGWVESAVRHVLNCGSHTHSRSSRSYSNDHKRLIFGARLQTSEAA